VNLFPFAYGQTQNRSSTWGRNFHHGFIRLHFGQWLVRPYSVTLLDQPAHDFAFGNTFANIGEAKLQCHGYL
jgi:hypothetical protein